MASPSSDVVLHVPDAHNPRIDLDLDEFMGTWYVTHSTLPLWKDKKDVTLTYVMKPPSKEVQFEDIVEYRAATAAATASPSRITGVDTLIAPASAAHTPAGQHAQTRFKWRGRGWLVVATSRWQVLGCSADVSAENPHAWAVTYFEKTLFTPPGLDVYARTAAGLPEALVEEIVRKAVALGGDVGVLARAFFEVERSGVERKSVPHTDNAHRIGAVNKIDVLNHMALSPS
ncbi:hypothetical protein BC628DRAFT_1358227 [Trametes gibbosa]|nr:hypothetical protein BC628DRAFT_1358227 [Trametes gibbosa]